MRAGSLKVGVVVLPFLLVFLGIRACAKTSSSRLRGRVAAADPEATVVIDDDELLLIAPDESWEIRGVEALRFRAELARKFGDLLGRGRGERMVVVIFSSLEALRTYARRTGKTMVENAYGFTDPRDGAIYLPPDPAPATLRHETVHLLMAQEHMGTVRYSPWLLEGLAQLFESYDPAAGEPPGVGADGRALLRILLQGDRIDVARLLRLDDYGAFLDRNGRRNYLEAHLLTAFLFTQRDPALLVRYVETEQRQTDAREPAFHALYRYDEEPFVGDLAAYVRNLKG